METLTNSCVANMSCYRDYYDKPWWWFRFRYDTQVKKNTCLHLIRMSGKTFHNQKVLEFGFGSGAVLFSFDSSCEIHGIELSETAISMARAQAHRKGYRGCSFNQPQEKLPFEDASLDIVVASHVLEHVDDDVPVLQEIGRVLKSDGIAVILVPINEKYDDPKHVRHYTIETLTRSAQSGNLMVKHSIENELLFHIVEKFYVRQYNIKWKIAGPILTALFNIPTSVLPFAVCRGLDQLLEWIGLRPKQLGIVAVRSATFGSGMVQTGKGQDGVVTRSL